MKFTKKLWLLAISVVLLTLLLALGASAETFTGYCGADSDGKNLSWVIDTETKKLTISKVDGKSSGAMPNYNNTYTGDPWESYNSHIKELVINEGVTSIGNYAFGKLSLEKVTLPESLTSIGQYAFSTCTSLTEINIPGSVENVRDSLFNKCTGLKKVTLNEGTTKLTARAFAGCTALTEIIIPASVGEIGSNITSPFNGCTNLKTITILNPNANLYPATVEGNESTALPKDTKILYTGNGSVKNYAIDNNYNHGLLDSTTPEPEEPTPDEPDTSNKCGDNLTWSLKDGVLTISGSGAMTEYAAHADVPWYDDRANITKIIFEGNVTTIGNNAFRGLAITEVSLPSTIYAIGKHSFREYASLTEITIPGKVAALNDSVFLGCTNLKHVTLEEGIASLTARVFANCTSLEHVVLPSTLVTLGYDQGTDSAFKGCTALKSVTFLGAKTAIYPIKDGSAPNAIPAGVTIYGYEGSTAQDYAISEEHKRDFVALNTPFASDCTTVFKFKLNAANASAGEYLPLVSLNRKAIGGEQTLNFLAADENGNLCIYINGEATVLCNANGTPIALANNTPVTVVYDDAKGTARFYVNKSVPFYGKSSERAVNVPVADTAFTALDSYSDSFITAEGVTTDDYVTEKDVPVGYVGFQVKKDDTSELRILGGIDMLYYDKVGFEISLYADGVLQGEPITQTTNTVYNSVETDGEMVNAASRGYNYFSAVKISGIDLTKITYADNVYFTVKTFSQIGEEKIYDTERRIYVTYDGTNHIYSDVYTGTFVPVFRFIASSDIHITDSGNTPTSGVRKLQTAIEQIRDYIANDASNDGYEKLDAVVLAGDIVDTGTDTQFNNAKNIFTGDQKIIPDGTQLVITMGNHDYGNKASATYGAAMANQEKFEEVFGPATNSVKIGGENGFHFITITSDKNYTTAEGAKTKRAYGYDFSVATVKQATELIEAAVKDTPNKPVFVIQHPATSDTVLGSSEYYETIDGKLGKDDTTDSAVDTLFELQSKYPNLIVISGHSHAPTNDLASIHQKYFTSINTGVLGGNPGQSKLDGKTFKNMKDSSHADYDPNVTYTDGFADDVFLIDIDAYNRVRIRVWDTQSGSIVGETFMIDSFDPYGFKYTEDRFDNDDIFFSEDAEIKTSNLTSSDVKLTFNSVPAESVVARVYKLVATDANGNEVIGYVVPAYYVGDRTTPINATLTGLTPNTKYTLEIYALNPLYSYDIADKGTICSEAISTTFTTASK